tara:strand:- start:2333 stop:5125 length:2793 start_codon:yes stop_codon:yes gene_type:complete
MSNENLTLKDIKQIIKEQNKNRFVNEAHLLTHAPKRSGQQLDENAFQALRKGMRKLGSWQAGTGLVGKFNKKAIERSDKIRKEFDQNLKKLSNDAVQEFIKWHEKEYPNFPEEDNVEEFFEGAVAVGNFYDGLAQQVEKYNDWYDSASKEQIIGGEMPPEEGLKPEVANQLITVLDQWLQTVIDTKMSGFSKRFVKEEEEENKKAGEIEDEKDPRFFKQFKQKTLSQKNFEDLKTERIVALVGGGLSTIGAAEAVASLMAASAFESGWPGIQKFITTWSEQALEEPDPGSQTVDPEAAAGAAKDAVTAVVTSKGGGALEFIARSAEAIELANGNVVDFQPQDDFVKSVDIVSNALGKTPSEAIEFLFVEGGAGKDNFDASLLSMGYDYADEDSSRSIGHLVTSGEVRGDFMDWLRANHPEKAAEVMAGGEGYVSGAPKDTGKTIFGMNIVNLDLPIEKAAEKIVDLGPDVVKPIITGMGKKAFVGGVMGTLGLSVGTLGPALVAAGFVLVAGSLTSKLLKKKGLTKFDGKPALEKGLDGFKGSRMGVLEAIRDAMQLFDDPLPITPTGIKAQLALPAGKETKALPPKKGSPVTQIDVLSPLELMYFIRSGDGEIIDVEPETDDDSPKQLPSPGDDQPEELPVPGDEEPEEDPSPKGDEDPPEASKEEKEKARAFLARLDGDRIKPYVTKVARRAELFADIAKQGIIGGGTADGALLKKLGGDDQTYSTDQLNLDRKEGGYGFVGDSGFTPKPTDDYAAMAKKVVGGSKAKNPVVYFIIDASIIEDVTNVLKNNREVWDLAPGRVRIRQWNALVYHIAAKAMKDLNRKKQKLKLKDIRRIYRGIVGSQSQYQNIGPLKKVLGEKGFPNEMEVVNVIMKQLSKYGAAEPSKSQVKEYIKRTIKEQYVSMLLEARLKNIIQNEFSNLSKEMKG